MRTFLREHGIKLILIATVLCVGFVGLFRLVSPHAPPHDPIPATARNEASSPGIIGGAEGPNEASSPGVIGGSEGPTEIFFSWAYVESEESQAVFDIITANRFRKSWLPTVQGGYISPFADPLTSSVRRALRKIGVKRVEWVVVK
ncbi:MAG: hypothetical protein LBK75_00840 [Oscillospiraceae bacterium]|jgi:Na+-transporting methylmalonyl-CoA/oxaloacetate decarboxylase beta subunit|nr:hypothetical protein [Oscillospiraceae bacterium]